MGESSTIERSRAEVDNRELVLSVDDMTLPIDASVEFPPPPLEDEIVAIITKREPKGTVGNMVAYNALPEMLELVNT
ncbi:hypothetical protein KGM_206940 [Danaus plexippus plexippus]|uniref:Uncharacterized protein n=1 Tax=Danaus plexippus plexippus TaxID=278856 RepID=A0A212FN20_DANPL|nr:hypothetical protein KGM_206940 [Danaus plexippus plexippus]